MRNHLVDARFNQLLATVVVFSEGWLDRSGTVVVTLNWVCGQG